MGKLSVFFLVSAFVLLSACTPAGKDVPASGPYTLLSGPWSKFLETTPTVYCVPRMPENIESILEEQQLLAGSVLSASGKREERPEFVLLADRLEDLKSAIPRVEARSGSVSRVSSRYVNRTDAYSNSDGSQYSRVGGGANGYRTVFSQVNKTSSPDLARSVENLVANTTLWDLDQRIDGLQQLLRVWTRKTEVMSPNGVEALMRSANMAFLSSLGEYIDDFGSLSKDLQAASRQADIAEKSRDLHLQQWEQFEEEQLPILHDYVVKNNRHTLISYESGKYLLPAHKDTDRILIACAIGGRVLYFELSRDAEAKHPFRFTRLGG